MTAKRKIEIFSAACPACDETIALVNWLACPSCEVTVVDMREPGVAREGSGHSRRPGRRD